jgi:hypothetical protein
MRILFSYLRDQLSCPECFLSTGFSIQFMLSFRGLYFEHQGRTLSKFRGHFSFQKVPFCETFQDCKMFGWVFSTQWEGVFKDFHRRTVFTDA